MHWHSGRGYKNFCDHVLPLLGPFVSADEVTSLLAQAGLFELAIDISKRFSLSMVPVFEALAARLAN